MINFTRQMASVAIVLLLMTLSAQKTAAQQIPQADNSIHDRMYFLARKSDHVILPATVTQHIAALNENNPNKAKAMHSQAKAMRVLYNKDLSKDDRMFYGNQLLKNQSASIAAIHADIKKLLTKL